MKYLLLLLSLNCNAGLLKHKLSEITENEVPISSSVTLSNMNLPLTGFGTFTKKTGIINVRVFVLQFFTQSPLNFNRDSDKALDSFNNVGTTAFTLTLLRTIDSGQLSGLINDYLNENQEDSIKYKEDIDNTVKAINTDDTLYEGKSVNLVCNILTNRLIYENSIGNIIDLHPRNIGYISKIIAIFFGNNGGDLNKLKNQLLNVPQLEMSLK